MTGVETTASFAQKHPLLARNLAFLCAWDPEPMEILSGATLTGVGLWFLLWPVFSLQPHYYAAMRLVLPEWVWGLSTLIAGTAQLATVYRCTVSISSPESFQIMYRSRRRAAFLSFCLWIFLGSTLAYGDIRSLSVVFMAIMCVTGFMSYIRLSWVR